MLSALLYLRLTSFKNWLRQRLLRLKQPKYLIGAIVGGAYFWFFFIRPPGASSGSRRRAAEAMQAAGVMLPAEAASVALAIGALALIVLAVLTWVFSQERASLGFSEAEIAFLFPAPVTRHGLVHFRLIDAQLRSLIGAVFMTVFSNRWTFLSGNPLTHAFGWWLIFSAFNLHLAGTRFTLTRLADLGLGTIRRRVLVVALLAAVLGATWAQLPPGTRAPDIADLAGLREIARWLAGVLGAAPLAWVLWPAKLVLGPFFAADTRAFLLALGPALLVLGAHYVWVVRSVVSFEEGSIDRAEKRAAMIAAMRSGERRFGGAVTKARKPPFVLAGTGRPELAFLWKNLLSTWTWLSVRTWAVCAVAIVIGVRWLQAHPQWRGLLFAIGPAGLGIGAYVLVIGPQFARQDIRQDLANADILKTYPLPGWRIVLGEILTPAAIVSGVAWLALLAAALAFRPTGAMAQSFTPALQTTCALSVAAAIPFVAALQLLVLNGAALVFPAWFQATRQRGGGGIDIMGQRLIFFAGQMVVFILSLLPAALLAFVLIIATQWLIGLVAAVALATVVVLAVLAGELWLGLWWLGGHFEKFDLSSELRS